MNRTFLFSVFLSFIVNFALVYFFIGELPQEAVVELTPINIKVGFVEPSPKQIEKNETSVEKNIESIPVVPPVETKDELVSEKAEIKNKVSVDTAPKKSKPLTRKIPVKKTRAVKRTRNKKTSKVVKRTSKSISYKTAKKRTKLRRKGSRFSLKKKKALKSYAARVRKEILSHKYYPPMAMLQDLEAQVKVSFVVMANGEIRNISLVRPSNVKILNESSLDIVRLASPVEPIPRRLRIKSYRMKISFKYTRE